MKVSRHDPANVPGPHDEFWGEQTEWAPRRPPSSGRNGFRARVARGWDAVLGGGAVAERAHGRPAAPSPSSDDPEPLVNRKPTPDRSERDPVSGRQDNDGDDLGDDAWELEPESQPNRLFGVDPLLARLGGLAVIVTLAAPLMVGITASGSDSSAAVSMLGTITTTPASEFADPTTTVLAVAPAPLATTDAATLATRAGPTPDIATTTLPVTTPTDAGSETPVPQTVIAAPLQDVPAPEPEPEPAETAPKVTTAPCGGRYQVAAGDYWFRLADAAGVSLAELLAVNDASVDTVLLAGRSICLPVGAATPPPPPPPTTASPAPTAPPATAAPTQPATTAAPAPTTTVLSRPAAVPQSQAAAIIRQVWPDELEERALEIAWRESNHRSNVNNDCCYGLFQIHWTAHSSWLATIGVTSASQLFDPMVNANAAYMLYQRAGGFGPWGG